jgi:hypothetical protein
MILNQVHKYENYRQYYVVPSLPCHENFMLNRKIVQHTLTETYNP